MVALFPIHGPDPDRPLELFDDGDAWFRLLIAPTRLPVKPLLMAERGGLFDELVGILWEGAGGSLALRFDPRYKVVVLRKAPVPWSLGGSLARKKAGRGTGLVAVELAPSEEAAVDVCRRILEEWRPGVSYRTERPMSSADMRRAIKTR